jgi:glycyl-tRNA synthetase (class II)
VDCKKCKARERADKLIEDWIFNKRELMQKNPTAPEHANDTDFCILDDLKNKY